MSHLKIWISQYGIIFDKINRVLLLRLSKQADITETWIFPGGRLDEGESQNAGLIREIKEETGLDVEVRFPCGIGMWDRRYAVYFLCEIKKPSSVTISAEHQDYKWFSTNEVDKIQVRDESIKKTLKQIQQLLGL